MKREMNAHAHIEQAFMRMRACAGNSDVKEMVSKFLSREQTYQSLLTQINGFETRYANLTKTHEEKREVLHDLKLQNDHKKRVDDPDPLADDRALAYEAPSYLTEGEAEYQYKHLSTEID